MSGRSNGTTWCAGRSISTRPCCRDPVIRREDGSWLYMLPSVVDDVELGVTHVVRGEDHVTNTAVQVQMFEALGAPVPAFAHEALAGRRRGQIVEAARAR